MVQQLLDLIFMRHSHSRKVIFRRHARPQGGEPISVGSERGFVKEWVRLKRTGDERSGKSLSLCLIGAVSISLVIVTVFGARSFLSEARLKAVESMVPAVAQSKIHAVVNEAHAQARQTAMAGDMSSAVNMYLKAELMCDKDNPARAELLNDLGVALTAAGRHRQAAQYLKEAIELNPSLIAAYNNLAISQMLSGDRKEALATLDAAVKAQPENEYAALKLKRLWKIDATAVSSVKPDLTY